MAGVDGELPAQDPFGHTHYEAVGRAHHQATALLTEAHHGLRAAVLGESRSPDADLSAGNCSPRTHQLDLGLAPEEPRLIRSFVSRLVHREARLFMLFPETHLTTERNSSSAIKL